MHRLLPGAFIPPAKTSTAPTGAVHRVGWDLVPRSLPSCGDLTKVTRYEVPGIERRISRPRGTIETLVPEPLLGHYLLFSAAQKSRRIIRGGQSQLSSLYIPHSAFVIGHLSFP